MPLSFICISQRFCCCCCFHLQNANSSFSFQYNWILTLLFLGELVLIVFIFVFYFVPDAKQKLGLFPEETFQDAIRKYGIVDDDDMKNLIDNLQKDVSEIRFPSS